VDDCNAGATAMIEKSNEIYLEKKQGLLFLGLLVTLTILFPFLNIFHAMHPARIFEKSAWIAIPVVIIGILYLSLFLTKRSRLSTVDLWIIIIILLSWVIFSMRGLIYSESKNFLDIRFIATSLIFMAFSRHLTNSSFSMRVVACAVIIQSLLTALLRSINFYFFPHIMTSYESDGTAFINTEGEMTRDLLIGSSSSANQILCGMFVLLSLFKYKIFRLNQTFFIMLQFFLMFSTFNSYSRFPMVVSIFVFLISLLNLNVLKTKKIIALTLTWLGLFILVVLAVTSSNNYFSRFSENSGGRGEKLEATLTLVSNSFLDFFIGSSDKLVNLTDVDGMLVSDNSYGLIANSFGVPFMLIFFGYFLFSLKKITSDKISLFFIYYIAIGLAFTNCILWEPWVFTVLMSFTVVAYYGRISICDSRNSG